MYSLPSLMKRICLSALFLTAPALAQAENVRGYSTILSAEEVEEELFGLAMEGESGTSKTRWSECITPEGDTVYHLDGVEMHGKLTVTTAGLACFSYAHQDFRSPVCFKVSRSGDGYMFWGGAEGVYKTQNVVRGVEACPVEMPPVS